MNTPARPRPRSGCPSGTASAAYPGHTVSDALLVAAGRGDVDAFAAFYDRTAPVTIALVEQITSRPDRVENLTRQVYLTLWRRAPRFDPDLQSAHAVLLRIARRALVDSVLDLLDHHRPTSSARPAAAPPRPGAGGGD